MRCTKTATTNPDVCARPCRRVITDQGDQGDQGGESGNTTAWKQSQRGAASETQPSVAERAQGTIRRRQGRGADGPGRCARKPDASVSGAASLATAPSLRTYLCACFVPPPRAYGTISARRSIGEAVHYGFAEALKCFGL